MGRPSTPRASPAQFARLDTNFGPVRNLGDRTGIRLKLDVAPLTQHKLRRASSPLRPSIEQRAKSPLLLLFDLDEDLRAIALHDAPKSADPSRTAPSERTLYKDALLLSPTLDRILGRRRGTTLTLGVPPMTQQQRRLHGALSPIKMAGLGLEQCHCDGISA